jgi:hypothetical protein
MLQLLQAQSIPPDLLQLIESYQLSLTFDRIALHSVATVVTAGCAILLIRTAAGTLHSRFLKHLAVSVGLNVVFRLGSVVNLLSRAVLAFLITTDMGPKQDSHVTSIARIFVTVDSAWHGIDITISLLASWFLITTWYLLKHYPDEGVSRNLFTGITVGFGVGTLGVISHLLTIADKIKITIWQALDVLDVGAAAISLALVGWQLHRTLEPRMKTKNAVLRATVPWATVFLYWIWAGAQVLYLWLTESSWYSIGLLMTGVSAIIMTIVLCSQTLEEKPEYHSGGSTSIDGV